MDRKQRISYVPPEAMDAQMREEMERLPARGHSASGELRRAGPRSGVLLGFRRIMAGDIRDGVCDHLIKELCRVYVSRTVKCEYCGNQRSEQARAQACPRPSMTTCSTSRSQSGSASGRKPPLAYAEAITWRLESSDALWERLYRHFSEPELVELGCFIALTMGQQSWLRLLDIEHHEVMPGTAASLAARLRHTGGARRVEGVRGLLAGTTAT